MILRQWPVPPAGTHAGKLWSARMKITGSGWNLGSRFLLLKSTVWSGFSSQVLQVKEVVSKLAVRFLFAEKLLT